MTDNLLFDLKSSKNYVFQKSTDLFLVQAIHVIVTSLHCIYFFENFFAKQIAALFKASQITQKTLLQSIRMT